VVIWGGISLANGFCRNYAQVLACRLLLGMCEAALSPCLVLYMTTFYRREELALRLCYLYMSSAISGVLGGLIAAGFLKMDGLQGLRGWQWLYIIEGALTILVGIIVYFAIANTYQSARYLNDREKWMMDVRQAQEAAFNHDDGFSWAEIRKAFTDPVIWLSGVVQLGLDVCLYGFSTFLVVIISEWRLRCMLTPDQFGFDRIASQGITAPVYFCKLTARLYLTPVCALTYLVGALVSMRYSVRYFVLLPLAIVTAIGYAVLIGYPPTVGGQLVGCFLAGAGIYICVGLHVTWLGQNVAGFRKRSVSVGLQQTIGNCGGVVAGQIYRSVDKPRYLIGHGVSLGFWMIAIAGMTAEYFIWRSRNAAREKMSAGEKDEIDVAGITGDHHYAFRYAL
jgi:MFS family permease